MGNRRACTELRSGVEDFTVVTQERTGLFWLVLLTVVNYHSPGWSSSTVDLLSPAMWVSCVNDQVLVQSFCFDSLWLQGD